LAIHTHKTNSGPAPEMNVTPLVDVVLVLLIIFMVMTPLLDRKFWVHVPRQEKHIVDRRELEDRSQPLVLRLAADRTIRINGAELAIEELSERLRRMFAAKSDHVLFFDAADDVPLGLAVEVMDLARDGGAVTIATLTTSPESN
jgi:biopolymer transport protein ExbD/biopolymer transport protein TolR